MAQTPEAIAEQLAQQVREEGSTMDVDKGPVYNFLIAPNAPVISDASTEAERIAKLVSHQFSEAATETEAEALASSFGVIPSEGGLSKGRVVYFSHTKPLVDRPVPRGSLVSTSDGTFAFFVSDDDAEMAASYADSYYNAATGRYELTVNIQAVAVGEDYDLPDGKINTMVDQVDGYDGVINNTRTSHGDPAQTNEELVERIRARFAGLLPESGGGIKSACREYAPTLVRDVNLVYPSDRAIFKRKTNRPAIDVYVLGDDLTQVTMSHIAVGGETIVDLELAPAHTVDKVLVNGTETEAYSFILDQTWETGGTATGTSYILFDAALVLGDEVAITYTYNKLIPDLQDNVFDPNQERPFDTDVLVREFREVGISIHISIKVLPSFGPAKVVSYVETEVFDYVEPDRWKDIVQPEAMAQLLREEVSGLSKVTITKFTRTLGGSVDIETVEASKAERLKVDQDNFVVIPV